MNFFSTNKISATVNFEIATIQGQAPDRGLYFPEKIPTLPKGFISGIKSRSKEEIAFEVIKPYTSDSIPDAELQRIVTETVAFDFPLVKMNDDIFSLELYHGPTLAFKDVGARFMSRCLGYFVRNHKRKVTVLVATSGDTGGAVANGFYDVDGVDVVILYPSKKVSNVQEMQLTTLGKNITAIEVEGNFDDCQTMVKQAFTDTDVTDRVFLTSANSINVARWLPQQFYYFYAYQQWADTENPPIISVPSGNFGNICAGLLAAESGLPIKHFIAACNANNIVTDFLATGKYEERKAVATISNAMDVASPSNFVRILEMFDHELPQLKNLMNSYSISDDETKNTIAEIFAKHNYLLDPHGAVAYAALQQYQKEFGGKGIILETAHPVKFYDVVEPVINQSVPQPEAIQQIMKGKKESILMQANYKDLKEMLLSKK